MRSEGSRNDDSDRQDRPVVILTLFGIGDLSGGGGAERFFADVFDHYSADTYAAYTLILLTDRVGYESLVRLGRLSDDRNVRIVGSGLLTGTIQVLGLIRKLKTSIVHIPLIAPQYLPFLLLLGLGRRRRRPLLTMTQVDCSTAYTLCDGNRPHSDEERRSLLLHRIYFRMVRLDGILTWYRRFATRCNSRSIRGTPYIRSARFCFVDTDRFRPANHKENTIIFAGRLVESKGPFFFLEAIRRLTTVKPDVLAGWKVVMYGKGPLKGALQEYLRHMRMDTLVELRESGNLDTVFPGTRIFVSAQQYENFTSLAMLEAMASGNAVVARNVGQTDEFVRHGCNGFLLSRDDPGCMADAITRLIRDPETCAAFGRESRRITTEYHTVDNFVSDLWAFWSRVLDRHSG